MLALPTAQPAKLCLCHAIHSQKRHIPVQVQQVLQHGAGLYREQSVCTVIGCRLRTAARISGPPAPAAKRTRAPWRASPCPRRTPGVLVHDKEVQNTHAFGHDAKGGWTRQVLCIYVHGMQYDGQSKAEREAVYDKRYDLSGQCPDNRQCCRQLLHAFPLASLWSDT